MLRRWEPLYWRGMPFRLWRAHYTIAQQEIAAERRTGTDTGSGPTIDPDVPARSDPRFGKPPPKRVLDLLPAPVDDVVG